MCEDCGCSQVGAVAIDGVTHHEHSHLHEHSHSHDHPDEHQQRKAEGRGQRAEGIYPDAVSDLHERSHVSQTLTIHESLLSKNDRLAERNRGYFQAKRVLALNILSSPGSGKTALIERMVQDLNSRILASLQHPLRIGVIVGDLETDNDAQRLRRAGAPAVQITTGNACHLEADMVSRAMQKLDLDALEVLIIENVGNLVCPASYDLGEAMRVVLLSVTEGEDKPLKYPTMFKTANVVLINKIDIAEAVGFDRERAIANIQRVAPQAILFEVSARTGQGMEAWYSYLGTAIQ
ncbi:hydrogenase nickel incorporation protein HypB [Allocoleopsis franciscana]|uniref:Hydrogenase nickel incorporation protein HypB n=1 Tax=Allocoleopsis franciscana PCC 7113 TaxID=1173027 RepID=K9WF34_9CYAN|nr:hydrogenase nickel incorporation protein HypB [Allocoleopsis franciscana]AFZ18828.1 Hydrogenase nickel incorporation protein HypB [Allocoleopsis franciscana PCC 7113]